MAGEIHRSIYKPVGESGLKHSAGYIDEEWSRDLKGDKAARFYREMRDNSGVIAALYEYVSTLLVRPAPVVERPHDGPGAHQAQEFVETCIDDMAHTWRQMLIEMMTALIFGWASSAITYKRRLGFNPGVDADGVQLARSRHDDGRIGWRHVKLRSQESLLRWEIPDGSDEFMGWWQQPVRGGQPLFIPLERTVHVRFVVERNNPEGRSALRSSKVDYFYSKRLNELQAIGIMRNVGGTVVAYVPPRILSPSASAEEQETRAAIEQLVQQVSVDERRGIVFPGERTEDDKPTGYALDTLASQEDLSSSETAIVRHDQRMAMPLLMQWLFMALDGVGAYGAQRNSSDISGLGVASRCDHLYALLDRHMLQPLLRLNTFKAADWPRLTHEELDAPSVQELAGVVNGLIQSGAIMPGRALDEHLRAMAGLPSEEDVDTAAGLPAGALPAGAGETVQDTALNGAQISSLREIVASAARGEIPRSSAVEMLLAGFPTLDRPAADRLLGDIGAGFTPATPATVTRRRKGLSWRQRVKLRWGGKEAA